MFNSIRMIPRGRFYHAVSSVFCAGVLLFSSGCDALALLGAGGPLALLGYGQYQQQLRLAESANATLPDVKVEIINDTDSTVAVSISTAIVNPNGNAGMLSSFSYQPPFIDLSMSAPTAVQVNPRGSATGAVKCADVIAVSATAPATAAPAYYPSANPGFIGVYYGSGNVSFSGIGTNAESTESRSFMGDIANGAGINWFIQPAVHGVDCGASTIVIRITRAGAFVSTDPSGAPPNGATLGEGTVSLK